MFLIMNIGSLYTNSMQFLPSTLFSKAVAQVRKWKHFAQKTTTKEDIAILSVLQWLTFTYVL